MAHTYKYRPDDTEDERDVAQDMGYSHAEAVVTLMKHGVAIDMPCWA